MSIRGRGSTNQVNMPSVPVPRISLPPVRTSGLGTTPLDHSGSASEGTSNQNNTIGENESNINPGQQTLVFLSHSGLEPSNYCSNRIYESFKSEIDPNGVNWKGVSEEHKDFYFGEFEKEFYWDPLIDNKVIKIHWRRKAARRYSNFISELKKKRVKPSYVSVETWTSWVEYWKKPETIEKSKIKSKNRRGAGNEVAKGTHTGGSITIGEHRKRITIEKGRDPTPSELHLHMVMMENLLLVSELG